MLRSTRKFLTDRRGAFAMQFALMVVPLTVCTGLAVDGGRAFLARYELNSALDAAALAVGSTYADESELEAIAQTFVDANFKAPHNGAISLDLTPGEDIIKLKGSVTIDTYFMPLVGQPTVTVSAESEVMRGGGNVEVALALDITGSMAGSKIAALKTAAKDLVDEVVNDDQTPYFSKVALAPWGTNFHVAGYAADMRGPVKGSTAITGAHWRDGTSKNIAANSGWRVGGVGKTTSAAAWKNGAVRTISSITKLTSPARIRVTVSTNPSYTNGEHVYITGANGSYTGLNGNIYKIADRTTSSPYTFTLQTVGTSSYVTPPSGSTNATAGSSQRCYDAACDVRITTTAAHGFAAGDFVRISGVGGMTVLNNGADSSWVIKNAPTTTTFTVVGLSGPSVTTTYSSAGSASECFMANCRYVINATGHGFAAGDYLYIAGATVSGSNTNINNSANTSWTGIGNIAANSFTLPGSGYNYRDWTSGGTVSECFLSTCRVRITSAGHDLAAGENVLILGVGGATGANNTTSPISWWVVDAVQSTSMFSLAGTSPATANMTSAYTANTGTAQCLNQGCLNYLYTSAASSPNTMQIRTISNCVTERTGAEAATDAAPSVALLGRDYAGTSGLTGCETANNLMPLTSDKTALKDAIDDMEVYGSTAGQIGSAWGWYLVSPNWSYLWPDDENKPKAYGTNDLNKVVVLMTDGEFNTAHCNGVTTETYAYSSVSSTDRIDSSVCTAADPPFGQPTAPFNQAQAICTAMKADGVIVYTVGFEVGSSPGAADFLGDCATDSNHAYLADDSAALKAAFKSIAKSISKLRLSK